MHPAHLIQKITETYLSIFRDKITQTTWENVLNANDTNDAYNEFLSISKPIYAATFPNVRIRKSRKLRKLERG